MLQNSTSTPGECLGVATVTICSFAGPVETFKGRGGVPRLEHSVHGAGNIARMPFLEKETHAVCPASLEGLTAVNSRCAHMGRRWCCTCRQCLSSAFGCSPRQLQRKPAVCLRRHRPAAVACQIGRMQMATHRTGVPIPTVILRCACRHASCEAWHWGMKLADLGAMPPCNRSDHRAQKSRALIL